MNSILIIALCVFVALIYLSILFNDWKILAQAASFALFVCVLIAAYIVLAA
jgi:hypothetical protein